MLIASSSIVRSRKRKLRELYAVATDGDGALHLNKFDVDAPPSTTGETKFLLDTDILQYVSRTRCHRRWPLSGHASPSVAASAPLADLFFSFSFFFSAGDDHSATRASRHGTNPTWRR